MFQRLLRLPHDKSFFLFGPRNTGKSTLIHKLFPQAFFIDLLDPEQEEKYITNPNELKHLAHAQPHTHIVIDEIQKAPKLLDVVHYLIESTDKYFIMTGSSARKIKRGGANLLAGRAFDYRLSPLSCMELNDAFDLNDVLNFGTLPSVVSYKEVHDRTRFLQAYTNTYLKEEVWSEQFIKKLNPFRKFLMIAAQMNGKIINFNKIARDVGVDDKTIKQYFEILEDTLLGFFLEGFQHSMRKRLLAKPKFYFFDVGVKRALSKQLTIPIRESTYEYGDTFEHMIILECHNLSDYARNEFTFSYFMTKDGVEIDLVVERPGKSLLFIEIKSKTSVQSSDLKGLLLIQKDHHEGEFVCFSNDPYRKIIDGITIYPWQEGLHHFFMN